MVCNKALEQALFVLGLELNALKIEIKQKSYIHIMLFICNTIKSNSNINSNNNNYNTIHRKCMRRKWAKSFIVLYASYNKNSVLCIYFSISFPKCFLRQEYTHNREAEKLSNYIV